MGGTRLRVVAGGPKENDRGVRTAAVSAERQARPTDLLAVPVQAVFARREGVSRDDQAASGYSTRAALIYFPTSRPITIDATKITTGNKVRLRWYDPTSGDYTIIAESEAKTSERPLSYPSKPHADGFNDWVLVAEGL